MYVSKLLQNTVCIHDLILDTACITVYTASITVYIPICYTVYSSVLAELTEHLAMATIHHTIKEAMIVIVIWLVSSTLRIHKTRINRDRL